MDELDFTPEMDETAGYGDGGVAFKPAETTADFTAKAKLLLSNAMDLLNAKITGEMAEASDLKTAVEIGKMFKIGMMTVEEAAKKALADADQYVGLEDEELEQDAMRFED